MSQPNETSQQTEIRRWTANQLKWAARRKRWDADKAAKAEPFVGPVIQIGNRGYRQVGGINGDCEREW